METAKAVAKRDSSNALDNFTKYYSRYLDGLRYMFGNSDEWRMEHVRNYRLLKYLTLTAGANIKVAVGHPFTAYLNRPVSESPDNFLGFNNGSLLDSLAFPILANRRELFEFNGFGQLFYNGNKFNFAVGANYSDYRLGTEGDIGESYNNLSPRLSGLWKMTDEVNLRSSWGTAFRAPNAFYQSNSYLVSSSKTKKVTRELLPISPEKNTAWESGIRWKTEGGGVGADLTWFLNKRPVDTQSRCSLALAAIRQCRP